MYKIETRPLGGNLPARERTRAKPCNSTAISRVTDFLLSDRLSFRQFEYYIILNYHVNPIYIIMTVADTQQLYLFNARRKRIEDRVDDRMESREQINACTRSMILCKSTSIVETLVSIHSVKRVSKL